MVLRVLSSQIEESFHEGLHLEDSPNMLTQAVLSVSHRSRSFDFNYFGEMTGERLERSLTFPERGLVHWDWLLCLWIHL